MGFGVADFGGIFSVFLRKMHPCSTLCTAVQFCGMFAINTSGTLSMLQVWVTKVRFDRELRLKFHFTTQPKFMLFVVFLSFVYNVILLVTIQAIHTNGSFHPPGDTCFFLLPWQAHLPFLVIVFAVRVCTSTNILIKVPIEENENDDFGIFSEHLGMDIFMTSSLCTHWIFAQLCSIGKLQKFLFLSDYLYMLPFLGHTLVGLGIPCLKVFVSKRNRKMVKIYVQTFSAMENQIKPNIASEVLDLEVTYEKSEGSCPASSLLQILNDDNKCSRLKKVAKKHFCSENVEFLIEAFAFKEEVQDKIIYKAAIDECDLTSLRNLFLSVVNEFIVNNSPCEVNLSFNQKEAILQLLDYSLFSSLDTQILFHVFDSAILEISKIVQDNLPGFFKEEN